MVHDHAFAINIEIDCPAVIKQVTVNGGCWEGHYIKQLYLLWGVAMVKAKGRSYAPADVGPPMTPILCLTEFGADIQTRITIESTSFRAVMAEFFCSRWQQTRFIRSLCRLIPATCNACVVTTPCSPSSVLFILTTPDIRQKLVHCCASVADAGATVGQLWPIPAVHTAKAIHSVSGSFHQHQRLLQTLVSADIWWLLQHYLLAVLSCMWPMRSYECRVSIRSLCNARACVCPPSAHGTLAWRVTDHRVHKGAPGDAPTATRNFCQPRSALLRLTAR